MSFIILKHMISLETTFLEFYDFSLEVLSLWSFDWRTETVGLILSTSSSNWTDQFLRSCKLSFRSLFSLFLFFVACEPSSTCMWCFNHQYESLLINDHNGMSWSFLWCFYVQIEHPVELEVLTFLRRWRL